MDRVAELRSILEAARACEQAGQFDAADAFDVAAYRGAQLAPNNWNMPPSARMFPWKSLETEMNDADKERQNNPRYKPDPAHGEDTGEGPTDFGKDDPNTQQPAQQPDPIKPDTRDKSKETRTLFNMDDTDPKKGGSPFHMHGNGTLGFSYVEPDFQSPSMRGDGFSWTEISQRSNRYSPRM